MYFSNHDGGELSPRSLYEQGEYSVCLVLLGDAPTTDEEVVLRTRCLIRLGRYPEAIRAAMRLRNLTGSLALEACSLLATAHYRAKNRGPSDEYFTMAYELARELGATEEATAELRYFDALRKWSDLDFDGSDAILRGLVPIDRWRQHTYALMAWNAFGRGDIQLHRDLLRESLHCRSYDIQAYAIVLRSYSEVARELYSPQDVDFIERHYACIKWTSDLADRRFYVCEDLGWICALSGFRHKADDYFAKAEIIAEGLPALLATVYFDKAYLAWSDREERTATENMAKALATTSGMTFKNNSTDRVVLLNLTVGCARMGNFMAAEECWQRYRSILTPINPLKAFGLGDKRLYALENNAHAWLLRVQGDSKRALTLYKEAFDIWKGIGYTWRAALTALSICDLGGMRSFADFAIAETDKRFPRAWFASRIERYRVKQEDPTITKLSSTKRSIIRGLVRGDTYAKIAQEVGIAEQTVTNHVQTLYARFSPTQRTRGALLAKLRLLGIE